jgi:hypothetical protein
MEHVERQDAASDKAMPKCSVLEVLNVSIRLWVHKPNC